MTTSRDFGVFKLSRMQAAAMPMLAIGSFPERRLYLNLLDDKFDLSRDEWEEILESLCLIGLAEHHPYAPNLWGIPGPTYSLTTEGVYLQIDYQDEMREHSRVVVGVS